MSARLLTLEEAAGLLGCSPRTLRRRIAAGALPVFRDGALVRVPERALAAYVADHTLSAASPHRAPSGRGTTTPHVRSTTSGRRSLFDAPDPLALVEHREVGRDRGGAGA